MLKICQLALPCKNIPRLTIIKMQLKETLYIFSLNTENKQVKLTEIEYTVN